MPLAKTTMGICQKCWKFKSLGKNEFCKQCSTKASPRLVRLKSSTHSLNEDIIGFKVSGEMLIPIDTYGRVILPDRWYEIARMIDAFYRKATTDEIKKVNHEMRKLRGMGLTPRDPRLPIVGYVYLLRSENGYYKIGRTIDINTRIDAIQSQFPMAIKLIHIIETDDYVATEKELHLAYEVHRKEKTEWFSLPPSAVDEICAL